MPALDPTPTKLGTNGLRAYFVNYLKPAVDDIAVIKAALNVRMNAWEKSIAPLREKYQNTGPTILNKNDNPAFVQSRKRNVKDLERVMKQFQMALDKGEVGIDRSCLDGKVERRSGLCAARRP